ncbi:MAG TPA: MFS transporter [Bacillales bacterium]|nr:MFS transporter [Bacillales bacterium]
MRSFAIASYALYFLGGTVITVIGSVLPQLLDYYHLSYTAGGQLVLFGSVGFIIGVPLSSFFTKWMSDKALLSAAASIVAAAQIGILLLPPVGWVFFFNFLSGVGVAAIETIVATLMMEVFVGRRAVAMSYLEVSFGVGALLMPAVASLLIANDVWRFSFVFTSVAALVLAVVWKVISFSKENVEVGKPLDASSDPPPKIRSAKTRWLVLGLFTFMIFIYTGIEESLNNFLSSIFISYLGEVPYYASLSIGIFWMAMVIGRVAVGLVIRKVTYGGYLIGSIIGALVCLICFILMKNAVAGYGFVALMGLAMSGMYSITMVFANHSLPGFARLVTSMITAFAGLGSAILPAFIGYKMDHDGSVVSLWYIVGFGVLYAAALLAVFGVQVKLRKKEVLAGAFESEGC